MAGRCNSINADEDEIELADPNNLFEDNELYTDEEWVFVDELIACNANASLQTTQTKCIGLIGEGLNFTQIANALGVSRQRVQNIFRSAIQSFSAENRQMDLLF